MPNKNGTGPNNQGPKTGRQLGNCEGATPEDRENFGRGCGRGRGRGFGFRRLQQEASTEEPVAKETNKE